MDPTDPTTSTGTTPPPPPKPERPDVSFTQMVGAALAAGSAAFVASVLGVSGTIIGAIVGSVVATVGSATYTHSLRRSAALATRITTTRTHSGTTIAVDEADEAGVPLDARPDAADADPTDTTSTGEHRPPWRRIGRIALATAAVLGLTLGGITIIEAVIDKPLASVVGGADDSGTSLGNVGRDRPAKQPSEPDRPEPTDPSPSVPQDPTPTTPPPTAPPETTPPQQPGGAPSTEEPTPPEHPGGGDDGGGSAEDTDGVDENGPPTAP